MKCRAIKILFYTLAFIIFAQVLFAAVTVADLEKKLKSSSGKEKIEILKKLTLAYLGKSHDKSLYFGQKTLELAGTMDDEMEKAYALFNLGEVYLKSNEYLKALDFYKNSLSIVEINGTTSENASVLDRVGIVYMNLCIYDKAMSFFQKSLKKAKECKNQKTVARELNNIALIYREQGDKRMALSLMIDALKVMDEIKHELGIAALSNNLAALYENLKEFDKALEYYFKALDVMKKKDKKYQTGLVLNNIGMLYSRRKDFPKAIEFLKQALKSQELLVDKRSVYISYINLGTVHKNMGNYDTALNYTLKSLNGRKKIGNKSGVAYASFSAGSLYIELKNYDKALLFINDGLKIAAELDSRKLKKKGYRTLSQLYKSQNNYKKALEFYDLFSKERAKSFSEERAKKMAELQTKLEVHKKEREIELLKANQKLQALELNKQKSRNNFLVMISILIFLSALLIYSRFHFKKKTSRMLREKNSQLESANKLLIDSKSQLRELNSTKDKFFSILSHDLKNPTSALFGSLEFLCENFHELSPEENYDFLRELNQSSKHMHDLLENLLQWSVFQTGTFQYNPEKIDVWQKVKKSFSLLKINADKKNIRLISKIKENTFVYTDKIMLATVVRNLVSNAIKFTGDGGQVAIDLIENENAIILSVSDTGTGISKEDIPKLFKIEVSYTSIGTSHEKGTGLGLILCKEFVERAGGFISVESELGKGSTFRFSIPKT
ncbi:MAG: tetratricopeptide repeat protein [bacterium]|nr:tetratricopeptide repeat protein [bacterium]